MKTTLKLTLLERGEHQYEIAARVGVSETRMSRIVRGRLEPTEAERKALARALGVAESELFPKTSSARSKEGGDK